MSSFSLFARLVFVWLCLLPASALPLAAAETYFDYREAIVWLNPMRLTGIDSETASILRKYYQQSFGGRETWEGVESIRFEGTLRMAQNELSFIAFKKKPDYCKIVLFGGNDVRIVMSYDGADAWQLNTAESTEPTAMPRLEALNFIRDAPTAGHLLYPMLPGKRIELLGRRMVSGFDCYELRVSLPNGQQITYAIDSTDYFERQQIVVNAVSGATEVTTHVQIEQVAGITTPMKSSMTVDGEIIHSVQMRSAEVNQGLVPWMFGRPSSAYVRGIVPEGAVELDEAWSSGLAGAARLGSKATNLVFETFGLSEGARGAFEASRFSSLDAATTQSIIDDIGDL